MWLKAALHWIAGKWVQVTYMILVAFYQSQHQGSDQDKIQEGCHTDSHLRGLSTPFSRWRERWQARSIAMELMHMQVLYVHSSM